MAEGFARWALFVIGQVILALTALMTSRMLLEDCSGGECDLPALSLLNPFYLVWVAVPVVSVVATRILRPRAALVMAILVLAAWLLLNYIVWMDIPGLAVKVPLTAGTGLAAGIVSLQFWIGRSET